MKTYLIQRGIIQDNPNKVGIDSIIQFDYMGASEYEWGALPSSLDRIRENINDYTYLDVPINGKTISVFCKDEQKSDVKTYLEEISNGKMRTKLGSHFDQYVNPTERDMKWQSKYPLKINLWWDIENDIIFWAKNPDFEVKFKTIINSKPI
jgi:hypothetical protein